MMKRRQSRNSVEWVMRKKKGRIVKRREGRVQKRRVISRARNGLESK